MEAQVDARALHAAMAKKVANRLERGPLAEQVHRQRVAQAVGPTQGRKTKARASGPYVERVTHRGGLDGTKGNSDAEKQPALRGLRPSVAQVVQQGRCLISDN